MEWLSFFLFFFLFFLVGPTSILKLSSLSSNWFHTRMQAAVVYFHAFFSPLLPCTKIGNYLVSVKPSLYPSVSFLLFAWYWLVHGFEPILSVLSHSHTVVLCFIFWCINLYNCGFFCAWLGLRCAICVLSWVLGAVFHSSRYNSLCHGVVDITVVEWFVGYIFFLWFGG